MYQPLRLHDLFAARLAQSQLAEVPPPAKASPAWRRTYQVMTLTLKSSMATTGNVALVRRPATDGFVLELEYRKTAVLGFHNVLKATIRCQADRLGTPRSWQFESTTIPIPDGPPDPAIRWEQSAEREGDGYRLTEGGRERRLAMNGEGTINWALLAVLGSLPPDPGPPIACTVLDDFDQVKPGLELRARGVREVLVGGKEEAKEQEIQLEKGRVFRPTTVWTGGWPGQVARFDLTGPGIVSRAYYTDQAGRVLFMAGGTEALALLTDEALPEGH